MGENGFGELRIRHKDKSIGLGIALGVLQISTSITGQPGCRVFRGHALEPFIELAEPGETEFLSNLLPALKMQVDRCG